MIVCSPSSSPSRFSHSISILLSRIVLLRLFVLHLFLCFLDNTNEKRKRKEVGACPNSKACVKKLTAGYRLGPVKCISVWSQWMDTSIHWSIASNSGVIHIFLRWFTIFWELKQLVLLLWISVGTTRWSFTQFCCCWWNWNTRCKTKREFDLVNKTEFISVVRLKNDAPHFLHCVLIEAICSGRQMTSDERVKIKTKQNKWAKGAARNTRMQTLIRVDIIVLFDVTRF